MMPQASMMTSAPHRAAMTHTTAAMPCHHYTSRPRKAEGRSCRMASTNEWAEKVRENTAEQHADGGGPPAPGFRRRRRIKAQMMHTPRAYHKSVAMPPARGAARRPRHVNDPPGSLSARRAHALRFYARMQCFPRYAAITSAISPRDIYRAFSARCPAID